MLIVKVAFIVGGGSGRLGSSSHKGSACIDDKMSGDSSMFAAAFIAGTLDDLHTEAK